MKTLPGLALALALLVTACGGNSSNGSKKKNKNPVTDREEQTVVVTPDAEVEVEVDVDVEPTGKEEMAILRAHTNPAFYSQKDCSATNCSVKVTVTNVGNYPLTSLNADCKMEIKGPFNAAESSSYKTMIEVGQTTSLTCRYYVSGIPSESEVHGEIQLDFIQDAKGTKGTLNIPVLKKI